MQAADQFSAFAGEREALLERMSELDRSDASIRDLVKTLDARKDEAISRTFKGVASAFKQVRTTRAVRAPGARRTRP